MKTRIKEIAVGLALLITWSAGQANADSVADILKKVDANLTKVQDSMYDLEVKVIQNDKVTKTLNATVRLKGLNAKLVNFTAPGDVRGMVVLTTKDGNMYVYLPSYRRVRKVASHVRNQGFMGTDLSAEDMSSAALSEGWEGKLDKEDNESWYLTLTPKKGNETSYGKMKITVLKKYGGVSKLEYLTSQGKVAKTQIRKEWTTFGPITMPTYFVVTDHITGSKTEMRFSNCRVNSGIPDSAFTKRAILRSN